MNDPDMDMFLQRAVVAVSQMMKSGATFSEVVAFHYAVGLSLMGQKTGNGLLIAQITMDGLDALHATAHLLADATDFNLSDYATPMIGNMHLAAELGAILGVEE